MAHPVTFRVAVERVHRVRVADRVGQQRELAAVEELGSLQQSLDVSDLGGLALQVEVEIVDRLLDDVQLMNQEVRLVTGVRLGFYERTGIASWRFADEPRDRQVLGEPVAPRPHEPEEEDPRGTAVAIQERVVIRQPEMEEDGADYRMDEPARPLVFVGEVAQELHPVGELLGWRWRMDRLSVVSIEDGNSPFSWLLQPTCGGRIVERPIGNDSVQFENRRRRETITHLLPHELKRSVVVGDHPLAAISGFAAGPKHFLGRSA